MTLMELINTDTYKKNELSKYSREFVLIRG